MVSSSVLCRHIHKVHRYICVQNTYQFVRYDTSMQMICHSVSLSLSLSLSPSYIMGNRETIIFRHNQGKLPGKEKKNGAGKWNWFCCLDLVSLWTSTFHNHLNWSFPNHSICGIWLWLPTQNNRAFLHFILSQLRQKKKKTKSEI